MSSETKCSHTPETADFNERDFEANAMQCAEIQHWIEVKERLEERVAGLVDALKKLANEASGFLALSDIERHGMTNSTILRDRIEQARDLIHNLESK